ncbi:ribonuclease HII [Pseudohongiella acticola]|mgnify:CR=1 FL=1|jgi:ribonuclease HII|uniref:ribonuclease HII n=1 Tax=Pseudohongiella acticola TaxID=1524254 RepID=UPI0030EB2BA1
MQRASELMVSPDRQLIAGVDEAGRGPLAGAVVAAAVILPAHYELPGLNDSKKLSEARRERLFELIQAQAVSFAIVAVAATEIDRINILQASLQAMKEAVTALATQPDFVYVDGNRCPRWDYRSEALVQGDSRLDCIAAASILAKVSRDRAMVDMELQYPGYGFARHKGYPTSAHMSALQSLGPCPEHRRSFAPVARSLAALSQEAQ